MINLESISNEQVNDIIDNIKSTNSMVYSVIYVSETYNYTRLDSVLLIKSIINKYDIKLNNK